MHHVKPSRCPACRYRMDAASNIPGATGEPERGDYSVCINCGEFLRFGSRLRLALVTRAELETMDPQTLMELARVRRAIMTLPRDTRKP